ncbi:hypothetical protein KKE45_00790, partial [Patescibacteria group bacterium]|nr:hypothetical protein [Patescibacteria group bacterium]
MVNRRDDPVMALCVLREGMIGGDYSVEDIGSGGIRITRGGVEIRQTEVGSKLRFLSVRQTVVNYNGKQQVV